MIAGPAAAIASAAKPGAAGRRNHSSRVQRVITIESVIASPAAAIASAAKPGAAGRRNHSSRVQRVAG